MSWLSRAASWFLTLLSLYGLVWIFFFTPVSVLCIPAHRLWIFDVFLHQTTTNVQTYCILLTNKRSDSHYFIFLCVESGEAKFFLIYFCCCYLFLRISGVCLILLHTMQLTTSSLLGFVCLPLSFLGRRYECMAFNIFIIFHFVCLVEKDWDK